MRAKFFVIAILLSFSAQAQIIEGKQLNAWVGAYKRVQDNRGLGSDYIDSARAMAYITGIAESYENTGMICMPDRTNVGQIVAIVAKYISENPKLWSMEANQLVALSLMDAFPCKK